MLVVNQKKFRLSTQFATIVGEQGSGKTSLAAAMICDDYRYHREERLQFARVMQAEYLRDTGALLRLPQHLYYSNISIALDPKNGVYTHDIDVSRLALPNDQYTAVTYLPRGAVIFIQEADSQLWCRDWAKLTTFIVQLLKLYRHNLLTIIFDTQAESMLDKAVRLLETDLYYVEESEQYRRFRWFGALRSKWDILHVHPQRVRMRGDMAKFGVKVRLKCSYSMKYVFKGDVFKRYDSFCGRMYFLSGIEKTGYQVRASRKYNMTPAGIRAFVTDHPLEKPEETKRGNRNESD